MEQGLGPPDGSHAPNAADDGAVEDGMVILSTTLPQKDKYAESTATLPVTISEKTEDDFPYCVVPMVPKILLMLTATFSTMIAPLSSAVYLPAVNEIAADLGVSITQINLTISMFLVFQGIAPSVTAAFGETYGRRPAYLGCFVLYLGANIGLALQDSYAALMVLRCLQSSASSGTVALAAGTISDLSTRAERGKYIGYVTVGATLGPAVGPVIGGLIVSSLDWHWIFWFLAIFCGFFGALMAAVFRETNRSIVGNGSIQPQRWNRSLLQVINENLLKKPHGPVDIGTLQKRRKHPNPLESITILADRETLLLSVYMAVIYAGYMATLSTFSSQIQARYGFSPVQIGLCYLPAGCGSLTSRWTFGTALDWNFRRQARFQGLPIVKNRQQNIAQFNVEIARLQVTIPVVFAAGVTSVIYGWVMEYKVTLALPLVFSFFLAHFLTGAMTTTNTLIVDINRTAPAAAQAANNLIRCLLAAGAVAAATPVIDAIGIGWFSTIFAFIWLMCAPCLWVVYSRGHKWRIAKAEKAMATAGV